MSKSSSEWVPDVTRYLDYFSAMTEIGKALTSSLELGEVLNTILESVAALMRPENWSLLLYDPEEGVLRFEIVVGEASANLLGRAIPMSEGIAGWVATHRQSAVCDNVLNDPRFSSRMDESSEFITHSIVCVPMLVRDELLGVIELVKPASEEPFGDEDVRLLEPFADFASIAIDNARSFERVKEMSVRDEWTGLHNARFLRIYLEDEMARAKRYDGELSVIFIDLDHFKLVNDRFGHAVGSQALRDFGHLLHRWIRQTDRAIRYGGDEFVLILPETSKRAAVRLAERIRASLDSAGLPVLKEPGELTASIGVASYPRDGSDTEALLKAADGAMYEAKHSGRNRVVDASRLQERPS